MIRPSSSALLPSTFFAAWLIYRSFVSFVFAMENNFLKKTLQHFRDHHPPAVVNGAAVCSKKSIKPTRKVKR